MLPKIHAKFRRRHGVPYAIERLSGIQFRCRRCNTVFLTQEELDEHLEKEQKDNAQGRTKVSSEAPTPSSNVSVKVYYMMDLKDTMRKQWLKLPEGDTYDGL